jgi:hypothetical protein
MGGMVEPAAPSIVEQATAALERHEWRAAFDMLTAADGRGELAPD